MSARTEKSPIDLLEEAVSLLKAAPHSTLAAFYAGTLPFVLAFLFFWSDMGRNPAALDHCAPAALGLAVLFVWMSAWQAVFVHGLRRELSGARPPGFGALFVVQAGLQPTKFIAIPVALLLLLPLAPVYAFYENAMGLPFGAAKRQAMLWQRQNWMLLGILVLLGLVLFINIALALLVAPQVLKTLLGIQTGLTLGNVNPLNSTFLAIAVALTYIVVAPISKAAYTLRCFYGESIATGEDLKSRLRSVAAAVMLVVVLLTPVRAQPDPVQEVQQFNRAVDEVMQRPEFAWRLPGARRPPQPGTSFGARILNAIEQFFRMLDHWIDELVRWLHAKFQPKQSTTPSAPLPAVKAWFYVLLVAVALILAAVIGRAFRRRAARRAGAPVAAVAVAVVTEDAHAGEQPPDEWLRRARDSMARGDLRMAVRALFLATLSQLGAQALISLDRGKSNRDYARELNRRARSRQQVLEAFSGTLIAYERCWYGMYEATPQLVTGIESNYEVICG